MRNNMRNIFITGATGFLASNLLSPLLENEDVHAYIIIRADDVGSLLRRKNAIINKVFPKGARRKIASRIHAIKGDITRPDLGLDKKESDRLKNIINTVYHSAALCELYCPMDALRKVNVAGTENVLRLAAVWQKNGRLENVNHISTAYIAGTHSGVFYEGHTDVSQGFNNNYEKTKFEAELVVQKHRKRGLPVDIYRPSIITDNLPPRRDGVPTLLRMLLIFTLGTFKMIPADNDTAFNMILVNDAAKAIYAISTTKGLPVNQAYHIVNPRPVKCGTLLDAASEFFGFRRPAAIPLSQFRMDQLSVLQRKILNPFIPYLNQKLSFDMRNADSVLKKYDFKIQPIRKTEIIEAFKHYKSSGVIPERHF